MLVMLLHGRGIQTGRVDEGGRNGEHLIETSHGCLVIGMRHIWSKSRLKSIRSAKPISRVQLMLVVVVMLHVGENVSAQVGMVHKV
jgi:hypothetical protein